MIIRVFYNCKLIYSMGDIVVILSLKSKLNVLFILYMTL